MVKLEKIEKYWESDNLIQFTVVLSNDEKESFIYFKDCKQYFWYPTISGGSFIENNSINIISRIVDYFNGKNKKHI